MSVPEMVIRARSQGWLFLFVNIYCLSLYFIAISAWYQDPSQYPPVETAWPACLQVDWSNHLFHRVAAQVFFAPIIWNILARLAYRYLPTSTSMRIRHVVCYALAGWISFFSFMRVYSYYRLVMTQPRCDIFVSNFGLQLICGSIMLVGIVLVYSSWLGLGVTGTCMGDHCGILMSKQLTCFPFNVLEHPMYTGVVIYCLASAVSQGSLTGLILALENAFVYYVTQCVEGPFTAQIYANARSPCVVPWTPSPPITVRSFDHIQESKKAS